MTKGSITEQTAKIENSGLKEFFVAVEIVAEKNVGRLSRHHGKVRTPSRDHMDDRQQPASDINPALAAGLHAVFVPHDQTWVLEHEELSPVPVAGTETVDSSTSSAELRQHLSAGKSNFSVIKC